MYLPRYSAVRTPSESVHETEDESVCRCGKTDGLDTEQGDLHIALDAHHPGHGHGVTAEEQTDDTEDDSEDRHLKKNADRGGDTESGRCKRTVDDDLTLVRFSSPTVGLQAM